jgi:hypothetical protein
MTALPQEAIDAAAEAVHRLCCEDGLSVPPDSHDTSMAKTILEAAAPYMAALPREHDPERCAATVIAAAAAAERERIRRLAIRNGAVCAGDDGTSCYFADLLREPQP